MSGHICTQKLHVYIGITYTITDREGGPGSNVGGLAGGTIVAIIAMLAIFGIVVCISAWLQK